MQILQQGPLFRSEYSGGEGCRALDVLQRRNCAKLFRPAPLGFSAPPRARVHGPCTQLGNEGWERGALREPLLGCSGPLCWARRSHHCYYHPPLISWTPVSGSSRSAVLMLS